MIRKNSTLNATIVLGVFCLSAVFGFPRQQVGIPVRIKNGYVLEFSEPYNRMVLDIGENNITTYEATDVVIEADTKFLNQKGIPIEKSVIRPGMELEIQGERFGSHIVAHMVKVKTRIEYWEVDVEGYFEKLEGDVARIDGQSVIILPKRFTLTKDSLKSLEQSIKNQSNDAQAILKKLETLRDQEFFGEAAFLDAVRATIGEEAVTQYQSLILQHARTELAIIQGDKEWSGKTFRSFREIPLGAEVEIKGIRQPNGLIVVKSGKVKPNLLTRTERELIKMVQNNVILPPPNRLVGGKVKIGDRELKLVESLELQQYVTQIGYKLIPRYIKDMPRDDPAKLTYRFYVIEDDSFNAFALPDGSVFVHTGLLKQLKNEAQLTAVLGHEIAHVTYEHPNRRWGKLIWLSLINQITEQILKEFGLGTIADLTKFGLGIFSNKLSRGMENQADRVGLFYMYEAGYDPREAPKVWRELLKVVKEDAISNFIYSDHPSAQARLKNLNREIAYNYYGVDFATTTTGEAEYQRVVGRYFGLVPKRPSPTKMQQSDSNSLPLVNWPKTRPKTQTRRDGFRIRIER
ncbi:MAG: M48 family metallopeptidase [Candidatus Methanomethylicaceae archaeon]